MGLTTTAPLVLPTRRVLVFTSSQSWSVPSSCLYADVMVVGGGGGGQSGYNSGAATTTTPGGGGAITVLNNLYLGGTGTVSVVVGAGGTGGVGNSGTNGTAGGYSGFGTYVYSQGGSFFQLQLATPGYKGTVNNPYNGNDTTLSNFAPIMEQIVPVPGTPYFPQNTIYISPNGSSYPYFCQTTDGTGYGYAGGVPKNNGTGSPAGGSYQGSPWNSQPYPALTLPWGASSVFTLGTPTAGSSGTGAGGAAGSTGYAGSGGSQFSSSPWQGSAGGPGAGGGGAPTNGANGGNGGNAGTNTGAGGGSGGSCSSGTSGAGGNGGSGFVIVSYIGTN